MSENIDWKKCTVAELRDHCTKHGLVATGKKVELVERLEEYQAAQMLDIKDEANEEEEEEAEEVAEVVKEEMEVKEEEETKAEEPEEKKEIIMVLRGKFHFYYNVNHALKMVIVKNFNEEIFGKPEFAKWCKQAKHFDIQKTTDNVKEAVLYFDTIAKGDGAFAEFKATIENDEVKVLHPADSGVAANSVSISAGQYWDKLSDYSKIAKPPATMQESKSESIFSRHVVLENVPDEVTEEELVEKFPEANCIHVYPYSDGCKGICMLEFSGPEIASGFVKENKELKLREQPIAVTKYNTRVVTWEKEKPKNEPYKPCSLTDEERIEKCKKLKELEEAKNAIINRDDLFGDEKILEHITVHEQIKPFTEQLKMDTNRRKEEKLPFPEPDELKNNYTKFAEAPDFGKRKKQSIFGKNKNNGVGNKRHHDGGARGFGDQPPHKRQMMGGGGRGGGGGYGGGYGGGFGRQAQFGGGYGRGGGMGGGNLAQVMKGISNALTNMERNMGGFRSGGGGGGGYGYRGSGGMNMRRY